MTKIYIGFTKDIESIVYADTPDFTPNIIRNVLMKPEREMLKPIEKFINHPTERLRLVQRNTFMIIESEEEYYFRGEEGELTQIFSEDVLTTKGIIGDLIHNT